jgi:hypothetical protein
MTVTLAGNNCALSHSCDLLWLQPFQPKLHVSDADFLSMTHNGKLCDEEGGLGEREFEQVMREQVA